MVILLLACLALMWFVHTLSPFGRDTAWRAALLLYPLPAVAAWTLGAPWLTLVLCVSAVGLFVRAWRRAG